jgi:nitrogen regulatory protein P-II 1
MAYVLDLLPMTKGEVVVADALVDRVICVFRENARTRAIGDGKVLVSPVEEAVSILTGERGVV